MTHPQIDNREWLTIQSNAISHMRNLSILITLIFMFENQLYVNNENNYIIVILCVFWLAMAIFTYDEYMKRKRLIKQGVPLHKEPRDYFSFIVIGYITVIGLVMASKLKIFTIL